MNRFIITGTVKFDPRVGESQSGTKFAGFSIESIAQNKFKSFFKVVSFNDEVIRAIGVLRVGDFVITEGNINQRFDKEAKTTDTSFIVDRVVLVQGQPTQQQATAPASQDVLAETDAGNDLDDDNIPF